MGDNVCFLRNTRRSSGDPGAYRGVLYAVVILTLIFSGLIPEDRIPYFFFDVFHMSAQAFAGSVVFIYALSYLPAHLISNWNRKLSWFWFKGVAKT